MSDDPVRLAEEREELMASLPGVDDAQASSLSAANLARYAAAVAAVDDPELVLGPATRAFRDMYALVRVGDRLAARGAAIAVEDICLQVCVAAAESAAAADNRVRFLTVILRWAWPRAPAVAAVLEEGRSRELQRWGGSTEGTA